ncbi:MAG: hypothetical protein JST79_13045 [Acidobacteria bacterium]|nr:hypothetical protein [Acidobacteriota bacterium]
MEHGLGKHALVVLALAASLAAQTRGVPASVTSQNFGGRTMATPGVAASVTSLGPKGYQPSPPCCINPLFPISTTPQPPTHRPHPRPPVYPGYGYGYSYYAPYYYDYSQPAETQAAEPAPVQDEYKGGPTIFDRRGSGNLAPMERQEATAPAEQPTSQAVAAEEPAPALPETLLVFKDGHELEIGNYAIIGDTLFDLTPGHRRKVALADLDLASTIRQNDDRGVDFRLPPGVKAD